MPIDDALDLLKGVPDYVLKEMPKIITRIPETIEDLQEMYKNKFRIFKDKMHNGWLNIQSLTYDYRDLDNAGGYALQYTCNLKEVGQLNERERGVILRNSFDFWQSAFRNKDYFYKFLIRNGSMRSVEEADKIRLEKWFDEGEAFILKEIPELEEFVKQYANR
jgi:hypothetical protein